jgi:PKD repeat protein
MLPIVCRGMRRAVTRRWTPLAATAVALAVLSVGAGPGGTAQTGSPRAGVPWRGHASVRETVAAIMARRPGPAATPEEGEEIERRPTPTRNDALPSAPARTPKAASATATTPTVGRSFLAAQYVDDSLYLPPDTMGGVSETQILVHVNGRIKVFDKDGNLGDLNATDEAFWSSVRNGAAVSDPQVEYDRLTDRWFVSAINVPASGANRIMIAVSDGPAIDSGTTWSFYEFEHDLVGATPNDDTGEFADYPQMGVDANAVYIGVNVFDSSDSFEDTTAYVVRKSSLLSGGPIVVTAFRDLITGVNSNGPWAPQGVSNLDPTATTGYFVGVNFSSYGALTLRRISDPGGTPAISPNLLLYVAPTSAPLNVPHLGGSAPLDPVDDRLLGATLVTNPAGQPRLWTAQAIAVNTSGVATNPRTRNAVRWYEIASLGGTPTAAQTGTVFDSASANPRHYWVPTIAASGQGHAALGMSAAGSTSYAGAAVATRLAGDPAGTMSAPTVAEPGAAAYNVQGGTQRWGDFSQTVVDPSDDMTFWTFQEYTSAQNRWGVRVIELRAPAPATPATASPAVVPAGEPSVDVQISGTSTSGSGFFDPGAGFDNRISAAVTGGVAVTGVDYVDPTHVVLHLDTTSASAGAQTVTITNPDGQNASGADVLAVCSGGDATPPTLGVSATDTTPLLGAPVDFDASASDADCGVDPATYAWDFEDDGTIDAVGASVTHAYSSAGTFTARATVSDYAGNDVSETISITVHKPLLAIGNARTREGDSGRHRVSVRITLGESPVLPVTVQYRTRSGTARASGDYAAKTGTVTFAAGETAKVIRIWVKGDVRDERNEYFFVKLSSPSNAAIADGSGKVVIVDDD